MRVAIAFGQFGPYHHARVAALQSASPHPVIPVQIAGSSETYQWSRSATLCEGLVTLCRGSEETASPARVFREAVRFFRGRGIDAALLPSYSPAPVFALYAAAVACGCRRVLMIDSHEGTQRATGWKRELKRRIVRGFHSALVAGAPQTRYITGLGMPAAKIFTGYDAVDNGWFRERAAAARAEGDASRAAWCLPGRYFLSLGRFVAKKNLPTLIQAYAAFCGGRGPDASALVMVGSGDQEAALREVAGRLGLPIHDRADAPRAVYPSAPAPGVYFYGFRQVDENPIFYAHAEAFILPSLYEEWGLVVNEAMASALPVVVSRSAGCAEDLVEDAGDGRQGNGLLFDPHSPEDLARQMAALADDPDLRGRMAARSEQIIARWGCENFAANALRAVEEAGVKK